MKNKNVNKNVFINLILAICIMFYFVIINFTYTKIGAEKLFNILKILSVVILGIDIILMEIAYRKENGRLGIISIEILILACHTLSISYIVELTKVNFENYILISSYFFSIYYVLKAIIEHTKERKEYLNSLSDIKEIVEIKPEKKVATKKNNVEVK